MKAFSAGSPLSLNAAFSLDSFLWVYSVLDKGNCVSLKCSDKSLVFLKMDLSTIYYCTFISSRFFTMKVFLRWKHYCVLKKEILLFPSY